MFHKTLLASALALAGLTAHAADYYVVVPLPGAQTALAEVSVALNSATLPPAVVGVAYTPYDLKPLLMVTGDSAYTGSGVAWSVVSSTLPDGLSLRTDGTIGGTPTASGTGSLTARATYSGVSGEQTYQLVTLHLSVALASATLPDAIVGQAYAGYDLKPLLSVTGDAAYTGSGVTWSVVSSTLPEGLSLRTDGTIGGTPTAAGTGTLVARATYRGVNGDQTYQIVALSIGVSLASAAPQEALVGQAFSHDLKPLLSVTGDAAYNGSGVTWSLASGSLPAGLTLNADGTITGTPSAAGSSQITARATYRGVSGEQTYQVVSLGISVGLSTATLPEAIVGQAYAGYDLKPLLSVTGDSAYTGSGVTWSVVSSTLPDGLSLRTDGTIGGTPTAAGTGTLVARASYKGVNGDQTYQLVTLNIAVSLATATLPGAAVGVAYAGYDLKPLLSVTGDAAYTGSGVTWSVVSSTLPEGLSLRTDGTIGGTPTAAGTGTLVARASYKGVNGEQTYQIVTLNIAVTLNAAPLTQGVVGNAYSYDLKPLVSVTGDGSYTPSAVTWSVASGTLPAGLTLNANGTITGTPTVAASNSVTFQATYRGVNGQQTYSLVTLNLTVSLATTTLTAGKVNTAYTAYDFKPLLSVTGDPSYNANNATFSTSGLPTGMNLSTEGVLSGTPSVKNSAGANFTVTATYKTKTGQQVYKIVVNGVYLEVTQIAVGDLHTCAVTTSGGAKCWGYGYKGRLGDGDSSASYRAVPVDVVGLTSGVASISAGGSHTCSVTTSGGAKCWGANLRGQLGDNSTTDSSVPVDVSGLTSGVTSILAGGEHTCALTTSGGALCWGYGYQGRLGNNSTTNSSVPVDVSGLTSGVTSISTYNAHTCVVTTAGGAQCWGFNGSGQLGNNSITQSLVPVDVSGLTSGVARISAGGNHTCAVTTTGGAKCWGRGIEGQLGQNSSAASKVPVDVSGLTAGVARISVGGNHTCAVTNTGGAKCWGDNSSGQIGINTSGTRIYVPNDVQGLSAGVVDISAGGVVTCAVTTSGIDQCWGSNQYGQVGNNSAGTNSLVPNNVVAP